MSGPALTVGDVTVNETTAVESGVRPGLGYNLYLARVAAQRLPDPDAKKGCTTTAVTSAGSTSFQVDSSAGYVVGDLLAQYTYADPNLSVDPQAGARTTIASGSNGQTLPQATINVASTSGFNSTGTIHIKTSTGDETVTYTGLSPTTFTGCSGGMGTMSTGGGVSISPLIHAGLTVKFNVAAIPDGTHITTDVAVPTGVTVPSGTQFGFRGSDTEWSNQVTPQLGKIKKQVRDLAIADAKTILGYNTLPLLSSFTAHSAGGGQSITENDSGFYFTCSNAGADPSLRGYDEPVSATPYKVTARIRYLPGLLSGTPSVGLYLRAASARVMRFSINTSSTNVLFVNIEDLVTAVSAPTVFFTSTTSMPITGDLYLRIEDTGALHRFAWSTDGQNFLNITSRVRTDFLADGGIARGFCIKPHNSTIGLTVSSWEIT